MAIAKQRSKQHIIDQDGEKLLASKLPRHWILRPYRPDYGLDFAIETFKKAKPTHCKSANYETLGEHLFIQLKSIDSPRTKKLNLFKRMNVEKFQEEFDRSGQVGDVETYRVQIEMSELITVERMGIAVPVLLVVADLKNSRCCFVCLNDYIDKILVPRHDDYRGKRSRTIHVPVQNEIGTDAGLIALRWYAKRPKLIAAFQRFVYQYSELKQSEHADWRSLAKHFARKIVTYDFWDDTEMWAPIASIATHLQNFLEKGQPGLVAFTKEPPVGEDFDSGEWASYWDRLDVFELWRQLSLLPKMYEDVRREKFLPTALGQLLSGRD